MKFDELMGMIGAPQTGDEMLNVLKTMLMADDLTDDEMAAVASGFMIGASFVLAKCNAGQMEDAAVAIIQMMRQFEATIFKDHQ